MSCRANAWVAAVVSTRSPISFRKAALRAASERSQYEMSFMTATPRRASGSHETLKLSTEVMIIKIILLRIVFQEVVLQGTGSRLHNLFKICPLDLNDSFQLQLFIM